MGAKGRGGGRNKISGKEEGKKRIEEERRIRCTFSLV